MLSSGTLAEDLGMVLAAAAAAAKEAEIIMNSSLKFL